MNVKTAAAAVLSATILSAGLTSVANAGSESTHEVPEWMNRVCQSEDSVNCWWDGGTVKPKQGQAFIRQMPGRKHMVCVFFANRPRQDYCS